MHWSADYVGIPQRDHGRTRAGCDCWGVVRLIYAERLGIHLPSYAEGYASTEERAEIEALIIGAAAAGPWKPIPSRAAHEFDLALFRRGRFDSHIGIVVAPGRMLHMMGGDAAKIEAFASPAWERRLRGIWRHESLFEASSIGV